MFGILIAILSGGILGYIFKKNIYLISLIEKINNYLIYLLLIFIGINFGKNDQIFTNIFKIGLESLIIAICNISGSLICLKIIDKLFFKNIKK